MLNQYKLFIERYYDRKLSPDENIRKLINLSGGNVDSDIVAKYVTALSSR